MLIIKVDKFSTRVSCEQTVTRSYTQNEKFMRYLDVTDAVEKNSLVLDLNITVPEDTVEKVR